MENKSGAKDHALVILPIRCGLRHLRHFVSCVSACLIRQCQGALKQEGQPQKVTVPGCPVCLRHSALFLSFWFQLARQATHNLGINTAFPNACDDNHYKHLAHQPGLDILPCFFFLHLQSPASAIYQKESNNYQPTRLPQALCLVSVFLVLANPIRATIYPPSRHLKDQLNIRC